MLSLVDSLRRRKRQPEIMDQPGLDRELHRGALRDLNRLHRFTGTADRFWKPIREAAGGRPLRILDLACGGGGVTVDLARFARRDGLRVEVEGADLSPVALEYARAEARKAEVEVSFVERDVLADDELPSYDVIVNTLFLHHLAAAEAVSLLAQMAQVARRMILCDDLIRSLRGWLYTYTGSRLIFRSPVVRVDGLLSVEAAFTPRELSGLAERAGLTGAELTTYWPQRQLLIWKRP